MTIAVEDIHWVAGFLEGEGWFGASAPSYTPIIAATQVQAEPLEKLRRVISGNLHMQVRKGYKPLWRFSRAGARAAAWMMMLYPLMSPRRQDQIEKALSVWKATPPTNRDSIHKVAA